MEVLERIKARKSIRSWSDKPVSRETIEKVIEAASYAPTNCNQQLQNFTVIESAELKERLIKEAAGNTMLRRVPVAVAISYDGWNYKEAIQGGALAAGYMLLAAEELGMGALPMNSYGADSKIKKVLGIPDNQTLCCFVLLGYPDKRAQAATVVPRRSHKEMIHYGEFGKKKQISFTYNREEWTKEDLINHQKHYCRKTFLGKEMDIMSDLERKLVNESLSGLRGDVQDMMSYDGAYIREFPEGVDLTTYDLCSETSEYTKVAAELQEREVTNKVLGEAGTFDATTSIFKLERMPKELREEVYEKAQGETIFIARKRNIFFSTFLVLVKLLFGKDVRKTGIYVFFGPYQPISLNDTIDELGRAGFKDIEWNGYFALPAFFEQVYQMFLQFRASEGSSYLHREKRSDFISRLLNRILAFQGLKKVGPFGSVVVIRCHK